MSKYFYVVLTCLFFIINSVSSQELFSKASLSKEALNSETIGVVDYQNNINLIHIGIETIYHTKHDETGKELFQRKYQRPNYKYTQIRGYSVNNNNQVILYFSNKKANLFASILLTEDVTNKTNYSEFELEEKNEKHLISFNDGAFYIYTYIKNSSIIKKYVLFENILEIIEYDLTEERFRNKKNETVLFSEIIGSSPVTLIEKNIPSSIEIVSEKIKLFIEEKKHVITLNHTKNATRIIYFDKKSKNVETSYYPMPLRAFSTTSSNGDLRSNSFIFKNYLYQFICSKRRIVLSAIDLKTKTLIKEYNLDKDDDLSIANEPIKQVGGTYAFGAKRDLEKTSQFLRKTAKSQDVGINVFQKNEKLNLSIGGKSEINLGNYNFNGFGSAASLGFSSLSGVYASYSATRSVYINCLLNQ